MKTQTEITEMDIYLFIFSPEKLSKEKQEYLIANQDRFEKEISLCKDIKRARDLGPDILVEKIIKRIKSDMPCELLPKIYPKTEGNGLKLAAASVLIEKPKNSISYIDEDSKYLVRIVKTELHNLLYLFSEDKNKNSYNIQIFPSETKYIISDTAQPIEIEEEKVEKIIVS